MKRKIFDTIKQKLCRHKFDFLECDRVRSPGYFDTNFFLYRCRKCGAGRTIHVDKVRNEIADVDPLKAIEYPVEVLMLPNKYSNDFVDIIESKQASYIVAKYYNKHGILLTAYGNKKEFESRGNFI